MATTKRSNFLRVSKPTRQERDSFKCSLYILYERMIRLIPAEGTADYCNDFIARRHSLQKSQFHYCQSSITLPLTVIMRERPDLTFPLAPDVREDVASAHLRQQAVRRGGMNLRKDAEAVEVDEYKWPEAGPSRDRDKLSSSLNASTSAIEVEDGSSTSTSLPDIASTGKLGPFGAKLTASVTGAVVVSLLSKLNDVHKRSSTHS